MTDKPFNKGTRVVLTEDASHYVTVPAGTEGVVESWSGPHSTMNGGGYDVILRLDPYDPTCIDIANAIDARLAELAEKDPEFYSLRMRAWQYGRVTVRSTSLREAS